MRREVGAGNVEHEPHHKVRVAGVWNRRRRAGGRE
jgi:hypothetical protein